jgi:hypothetical protein
MNIGLTSTAVGQARPDAVTLHSECSLLWGQAHSVALPIVLHSLFDFEFSDATNAIAEPCRPRRTRNNTASAVTTC